jgi:hypothetical protein
VTQDESTKNMKHALEIFVNTLCGATGCVPDQGGTMWEQEWDQDIRVDGVTINS